MRTINFEDKGQDFLEWVIEDDVVIDCQPHQFKIWQGKKVVIEGNNVSIENQDGSKTEIKYKVLTIADTSIDYAEGYRQGLTSNKDNNSFHTCEQYRFGYLVAQSSLS
jgi:hypothetical protein